MYDHSDSGDGNSSLRDHHPQQHPQQQQQQSNVGLSSPLDKYQRFESWLKENGAQFDLVSFDLALFEFILEKKGRGRERKKLTSYLNFQSKRMMPTLNRRLFLLRK